MSLSIDDQNPLTSEQIARQFELAKLDYSRLATQEQSLMDKRMSIWIIFFAILSAPSGYTGLIGLKGSIYLFALVPFFTTCIALDMKHDEKVLRYDVRKKMKNLAKNWGFKNHDSDYSAQDGSRWWHGYYKIGKTAAFIGSQCLVSILVSTFFFSSELPLVSIALAIVNLCFMCITAWCML